MGERSRWSRASSSTADYLTLFNTSPAPAPGGGGGAGLPCIIVKVVWIFIVPSASIERLSTRAMPGAVIVVTSTAPSHVLVRTFSTGPFGPSMVFFDGVPSSRYTVDSELPATVMVTVILLPSTVIVHVLKLPPAFHVPAKFGLSCADTPAMNAIASAAERSARFIFTAPLTS